MKISFLAWLKEYAFAYLFGLFIAFCVYILISINALGWAGALTGINSKVVVMMLLGPFMFIGQLINMSLLGHISAMFDLLLALVFFALPILLIFIAGHKKRKIFWALWGFVWATASLVTMGIALSMVVPV